MGTRSRFTGSNDPPARYVRGGRVRLLAPRPAGRLPKATPSASDPGSANSVGGSPCKFPVAGNGTQWTVSLSAAAQLETHTHPIVCVRRRLLRRGRDGRGSHRPPGACRRGNAHRLGDGVLTPYVSADNPRHRQLQVLDFMAFAEPLRAVGTVDQTAEIPVRMRSPAGAVATRTVEPGGIYSLSTLLWADSGPVD